MKFTCEDLNRALRNADPELLAAAADHARDCAACRSELDWWREISITARTLHRKWESPDLWRRIQSARRPGRMRWALAAAAAVLIGTFWLWPAPKSSENFLTEQALADARTAEAAYIASIDKLAILAGPRLARAESPLMANYRERLQLLDEAIAELRSQAEGNPFYAQVRGELSALYREKQKTLEEVLNHDNPKI